MLNFLLILLMVFIEAAVNAGFLLNAQLAASPVSAILFSLLVSVTNVFLSIWVGFYVGRWRHYGAHASDADNPAFVAIRHRAHWQFWVYITVIALLHATLGQVRARETLDSVEVSLSAYLSIFTVPEALFLVLTGIGMSVLSYHKGMSAFTDSYPHYGQYHNAAVTAYEALQAAYAYYVVEIEERHAAARSALDRDWKDQRKTASQVGHIFNRCLRARKELIGVVKKAESALRADIASLAQTHRAARGDTTPLPEIALHQLASFQSFLENCDLPAFGETPDIQQHREALDMAKAEALRELRSLFEELHATHGGETS